MKLLDRIVQHLLDSCEPGAGCFALDRKPTELRALLEQVIEQSVSTVDRGRVILDAPAPITVTIDELRIERVIANLIGNALKYAPKSSRIVVRLEVGALAAQISVADAGPGLVPAELERIFDKYCRGASAHGVAGRGLGLYVCKTIVEAHGGQMGVDSVHGAGSRFYFDLPALST
ncbi:MAG TPA: ATP-binding protein [Kofleriaceae bacterium]|nr:ATP-binding protein [Kofleriaceae bacterium]